VKPNTLKNSWRTSFRGWWQRRFPGHRSTPLESAQSTSSTLRWRELEQQAHAALRTDNTEAAIQQLQDLLAPLTDAGADHAASLDLGRLYGVLGSAFQQRKRPDLALEPAQQSVDLLERFTEHEANHARALALITLGNAHYDLGNLAKARDTAHRGLELARASHLEPETAEALLVLAATQTRQHLYDDADDHYAEALAAARRAGERYLEGKILQRQGILQRRQSRFGDAIDLLKLAIACFQQVGDEGEEMRTCDMLGNTKTQLGELHGAETWYARSRALAEKRQDQGHSAIVAHNMGILYQKHAEQAGDSETRELWLQQAIESIRESLAIKVQLSKPVGAEASHFQLGVLHWRRGELKQAEQHMLEATSISETLGLPKVYQNYSILGRIARDRGDTSAAAEWNAKCVAKVVALKQRKRS
jgi:tetratricopeptide (TPR) repeat protein